MYIMCYCGSKHCYTARRSPSASYRRAILTVALAHVVLILSRLSASFEIHSFGTPDFEGLSDSEFCIHVGGTRMIRPFVRALTYASKATLRLPMVPALFVPQLPHSRLPAMSSCTQFCIAIHNLPLTISTALSREVLLEHLPPTNGIHEWHLGTWSEVTRRDDCQVCRLVIAAINESLQQNEGSRVSPEQSLEVLLLPDEASFRVSYPTPISARLAFIGSEVTSTHSPDTVRLVRHEGIDVARVQNWLRTCDENHSSCTWRDTSAASIVASSDKASDAKTIDKAASLGFKKEFNEAATSNFRVIDIVDGYIKPVPLDTKYVALSYVWGQLPMLQLRKENFDSLTSRGALESICQQLPRTITDAIDLLKALGLRYLWIDGLCLVQDDAKDVTLGVSMMNSIYHGSYFTIVAAAGQDANAGLPGLQQGSECPGRKQNIMQLPSGLQLTICHSIDWHLRQSVHNQRGWTLQELVLPDRTLIFVNGKAYFRCHEANWSEETWADQQIRWLDADDSNISRLPDPLEGFLPSCWAYQKICEDFSRRKLRNDGDALRALQGILRPTAAGMDTDLIEGLPGYYLDHFLLFISGTGDMKRRSQFASYSWAAWEGSKMWPRENYEWPSLSAQGVATSKRETENILRFFEHNRLVEWSSVGFDAVIERLTSYHWDVQSWVFELMQKHLPVFGEYAEDPVAKTRKEVCSQFVGSSVSSNTPDWCSHSYSRRGELKVHPGAGVYKRQPLPDFCMSALDLANGQAEFDRLIDRMTNTYAKLAMCNWMAVRRSRKSDHRVLTVPSCDDAESI